jgi:hypothetical protein
MKPTCYSYVRFSQLSQSEGGSLERQSMTAQEYAEKEGLVLDTTTKYQDLGVSAFKGKNARRGALKEFMEAVESKKVKAGSYLLIEDMDRLTRLPVMEGLEVFQRILRGGITIVTLKDGAKYSTESIAENWTLIMPVLFNMSRGWGESDRKSYLLTKAWKKKKEGAEKLKPMGDNAPRWLAYVQDEETGEGRYVPISERVELVRRIFNLSADGYGHSSITAMLNQEGVKPFRRPGKDTKDNKRSTWGVTSVARLLGNRAVLGEYQPWSVAGSLETRTKVGAPVPGYYPPIVEIDLFNRVQDAIAGRKINRTTKQTKHFNLWAGVGVCAGCGASMCLNKKGVSRLDKEVPLTYLICSNREKGVCQETGVRLDASEAVFLEILATTGNLSLVQDDIAMQENQLQAARGRLIAEREKFDSNLADYEATGSRAVAIVLAKQEQKVADTEAEIARLEGLLAANTVIDRQAFFERINLSSRAARNQANALLKRLGIKVAIRKAGSRAKLAYYAVYQHENLIMKLHDNAGKIETLSYSQDVSMRLHEQGELQEHELGYNLTLGSKKLPKPVKDSAGAEKRAGAEIKKENFGKVPSRAIATAERN